MNHCAALSVGVPRRERLFIVSHGTLLLVKFTIQKFDKRTEVASHLLCFLCVA